MGKSVTLLLVLVFLLSSCIIAIPVFSSADTVEDSWASKAPMQVARSVLGVAVVNGKIYAIGGSTESGFAPSIPGSAVYGDIDIDSFVGTNEEYDPATDTWTTKAPMPTPRIVFATAAYQNKIYCIGGRSRVGDRSGGYTGVNEVYDPATDTWERKTPMPTARGWLTAGVVNGKIYLLGGDPQHALNEVYDPATDSWTTKASLPFPIVAGGLGSISAVVDNKIYVIGSKTQIYDAVTDEWRQGTPPPSNMVYAGADATTGEIAPERIYVFGEASTQAYDVANDNWTVGASVLTRRYNFGVAVVNDSFYAIGGHTYSFLPGVYEPVAVNEQYTPFGYGTVPPVVSVVSPGNNETYASSNVSLAFTVNKPAHWTGYSLDGQDNVTTNGNTTLAGLTNGVHNVTVYAKDTFENTGASETISFTVAKPEPFPIAQVAATSASIAVIGVGLLVYYKKHKGAMTNQHNNNNSKL